MIYNFEFNSVISVARHKSWLWDCINFVIFEPYARGNTDSDSFSTVRDPFLAFIPFKIVSPGKLGNYKTAKSK